MVKGPNIYTINSSSFTTREQAYLRSQPFCLHTNVVCYISLRLKTVVLSSTAPLGCRNSTWADGTGDAKLRLTYTRCWAMGSHEAPMHHSGDGRIQLWALSLSEEQYKPRPKLRFPDSRTPRRCWKSHGVRNGGGGVLQLICDFPLFS